MRKNQTSFIKNRSIVICLISAALAIASPAVAETQIDISYDTPSFKNKELISEPVKITVSYDKPENYDTDIKNLQYQLFYNNTPRLNSGTFTTIAGSVSLKDLDSNKISEVIISTFSGGAHCCTNFTFYTFQQGWEFVLANYDHTSDWDLTIYQGDREVGKYPNFPTALKSFLAQHGYLNRNMHIPKNSLKLKEIEQRKN